MRLALKVALAFAGVLGALWGLSVYVLALEVQERKRLLYARMGTDFCESLQPSFLWLITQSVSGTEDPCGVQTRSLACPETQARWVCAADRVCGARRAPTEQ